VLSADNDFMHAQRTQFS